MRCYGSLPTLWDVPLRPRGSVGAVAAGRSRIPQCDGTALALCCCCKRKPHNQHLPLHTLVALNHFTVPLRRELLLLASFTSSVAAGCSGCGEASAGGEDSAMLEH